MPRSVPLGKNSRYSNFRAANSDRWARKSYPSDSKAEFLCPISYLGWAPIIRCFVLVKPSSPIRTLGCGGGDSQGYG